MGSRDRGAIQQRAGQTQGGEILRLAAGHAHVACDGRALVTAVDDEVVALGLAGDGGEDGGFQFLIIRAGTQDAAT